MLNNILLQTQGTGWANILMIVVLIAIFYLFMIRPQQKKQNEIKKIPRRHQGRRPCSHRRRHLRQSTLSRRQHFRSRNCQGRPHNH